MNSKKVAFLFSGQGAQYVGMGKELYKSIPECKEIFDKGEKILNMPIKELIFNGPEEKLMQTELAQPAILLTSLAALKACESSTTKVCLSISVKSDKELKRVNFLLDIIEVNSMVEYVTEYIQLWKQANFNKFLENRQAFSIRAYENGYDEKSINSWNSNKNENKTKEDTDSNYNTSVQNRVYNGDVADQSSSTRNGQIAQKEQYYCEDCGAILSKKNAITTKKSFKKALCSNCLKNNLGK